MDFKTKKTPILSLQKATSTVLDNPKFASWFARSKVVDHTGNPLVVYHATPNDFSAFKPGGDDPTKSGRAIWFGTNAVDPPSAHNVLQGRVAGRFRDSVRTVPVYLSIKAPLVIDDQTRQWVRSVWGPDFPQVMSQETIEDIRRDYDGVIFHSPLNGMVTEFVVFEPTQIKSALANSGEFDPDDPDFTK